MISVVCVYNNEEILKNWLLKSLNSQTASYEFIPVNNNEKKFTSAAEALNYGGALANGQYIMFVHQDIDLLSNTFLADAEKILDGLDNLGVAGVAGVSENGRTYRERCRNLILERENPTITWGTEIEKPEIVQTLDECLFFVPKKVFTDHPFDAKTCDNWHFYAVDYCLSSKSMGMNVHAIPLKIFHQSMGFHVKFSSGLESVNYLKTYYRCLTKLIIKHKLDYPHIYTSNGDYYTNKNLYLQDSLRLLKNVLP